MFHICHHAQRHTSSTFVTAGRVRVLFTRLVALCAITIAVGLLGGLPLRAQTVASFWEAQTVPFNSTTNGTNFAPLGIAVDTSGNLYILDGGSNNQVVKETLQPGGTYTQSLVANGTNNGINGPIEVAVDPSGNVYIVDPGNTRVLMEPLQSDGSYDPNKQIVVADSNSTPYPLGDPQGIAVDTYGNVYISDFYCACVVKETPPASSGNPYAQSLVADNSAAYGLLYPQGIAVDGSGNVYITDPSNKRVVKETPPTSSGNPYIQSLVADGSAAYGLQSPTHVAVDGSGNVYIADYEVLKETPSGGSYTQSLVANSTYNGLGQPWGVAVDGNGNVFIVDINYSQVLKEMMNSVDFGSRGVGGTSSTIPLMFSFNSAHSLNSTAPYQVLTMGASGQDFAAAGTGNTCNAGGAYTAGQVCTVNVAFAPLDAGTRDGAVVLIDASGSVIATAYLHGAGQAPQITYSPGTQSVVADNGLATPESAVVDGSGNVYIADTSNNRVLKETLSGGSYAQSILPTSTLYYPFGVAVDGAGNVYIADTYNDRVLRETWSGGTYTETAVATGLNYPSGVAVDGAGNVYIADTYNDRVLEETLSGGTYTQSVIPSSTLSRPWGVAVDGNGNVYIADTGNDRVLKETWSGAGYTETVVPTSGLLNPTGVAVDGSGNVYIADLSLYEVMKETLSGGVYTQSVVADSSPTYGLNSPAGVAVDGSGNVYIADSDNNRVLEEDLSAPPSLSFGSVNAGSASTAQSVEIINNGNQALVAVSPGLAISGDFTVVTGGVTPPDCTATFSVAPGLACILSIEFTPIAGDSGTISGSVTLTDNNLNSSPSTQSIPLSGVANAPQVAPTITSPASTTFTVGTAGSLQMTATGYPAPTFSETGTLPSNVTLSTAGLLSGTPAAGTGASYPLTITASNGIGTPATQSFTLTVDQAPAITTASSTTFTVGTAGTFTVTASGYPTATLGESGAMPSGVSFTNNGNGTATLAGTPASGTAASYPITFTASNGVNPNATQSFTLTVQNAPTAITLSPSTLSAGTVGSSYSQTLTAAGGTAPYTFSVTSGALPGGLSLTRAGVLSGTPMAAGSFSFTVQAKDRNGNTGSRAYTLVINAPTITLSPTSLPAGTVGRNYNQTLTASGGTWPYTYSVTSGALPTGLTLNTAGVLSGTPTAAGSFGFRIQAKDAKGFTGSQAYTLTINAPTITLSPASLTAGTVGRSYYQTLTASGGTWPYTYSVTSGALPTGLTLNTAGVLSGTPKAGGSFGFTIQAKDAKGFTGSHAYTLVINAPTIALSPTSLSAGTVGKSYRQTLTASGGTSPYTYSVTSGALPAGLTLTTAGVLSGTPTARGTASFTVTARDSSTGTGPYTGSQAYRLVVN